MGFFFMTSVAEKVNDHPNSEVLRRIGTCRYVWLVGEVADSLVKSQKPSSQIYVKVKILPLVTISGVSFGGS